MGFERVAPIFRGGRRTPENSKEGTSNLSTSSHRLSKVESHLHTMLSHPIDPIDLLCGEKKNSVLLLDPREIWDEFQSTQR